MGALSVIRKELQEISHDRTMLAVLLVFPVFIMLFMGSSFNTLEVSGLPIGVAGPVNTSFAGVLFEGLSNSSAFNLHEFGNESEAMDAFRNGQVRAVIVVPGNFEQELEAGNGSTIRIVVDNSDIVLEQSILAAMGAVVQGSSADITRAYVSSAWADLEELDATASSLAADIVESREKMEETKVQLGEIEAEMEALDIEGLSGSIEEADLGVLAMQELLAVQREAVLNASAESEAFFNQSDSFLGDAGAAINESILTVGDAHAELTLQKTGLEETAVSLGYAIEGLELLQSTGSEPGCTITLGAIDITILSLEALRNNTLSQIEAVDAQLLELKGLNATLWAMSGALENYSLSMELVRAGGDAGEMVASLDQASATLSSMGALFAGAQEDVEELESLLETVKDAMEEIEGTLDDALEQTSSVDGLISSLQGTVEEQTGKDPENIAVPLSIEVENHYVRTSFVDFIMPQVIAVSLLLSCFLLASISLVREKTRKTIVRSLLVPNALPNLVVGKVASIVIISFAQVVVILLVAALLFGVALPSDLVVLATGILISSLVLSSIGILVGFFSKNESAAIQGCLILAIPMMFLGNIIFSPDLLPTYTQVLQDLLPLAHVTNIFKIVIITNGNPAADVGALFSYFVLLAILIGLVVWKRREITAYS